MIFQRKDALALMQDMHGYRKRMPWWCILITASVAGCVSRSSAPRKSGSPSNTGDLTMAAPQKETDLDRVDDLGRRIAEILSGNPPAIQGAVLADLLSMWCAGHQSADREALEDYREE